MTDSQLSVSLSTLLCQEAEECFDEDSFTNLKHCATTSQTDDDFVQVLLHREVSARKKSPSTSFAVNPSWIKSARPEAIAWFLIVSFDPFLCFLDCFISYQIVDCKSSDERLLWISLPNVYLSVTYVDGFCSTRSIVVKGLIR